MGNFLIAGSNSRCVREDFKKANSDCRSVPKLKTKTKGGLEVETFSSLPRGTVLFLEESSRSPKTLVEMEVTGALDIKLF